MGSVIFYISVFSISSLMLSACKRKRGGFFFFFIAVALPVFVAALRDGIGTDYENYVFMYQANSKLSFGEWFRLSRSFGATRFGVWLMARVAGIFNSKEVFLGFFSVLTLLPVAWRLSTDYDKATRATIYFIYLMTCYSSGLNICKQMAAIGILFFGLRYVQERKLWKFLLIVLCAASLHVSALIAVVIYFMYDADDSLFTMKKAFLLVGGTVMLLLLPQLLKFLGDRFEDYLVYEGTISNLTFFADLFWCVLFCLLFQKYINFDKKNGIFIMMMMIGVLLDLSGFYSPYIKRIAQYFTFSQVLLIGQLPQIFSCAENRRFARVSILAYTVVMFIGQYYILGFGDIIPYKFIGGIL